MDDSLSPVRFHDAEIGASVVFVATTTTDPSGNVHTVELDSVTSG